MSNAFDLLDPAIQAAVAEAGMGAPTAPQEAALSVILAGKHCLLLAPTGHGKTEAALLPLFHTFLKARNEYRVANKQVPPGVKLLYVTPLRALNRDMLARVAHWGEKLGIAIAVRHGDTPAAERHRQSLRPPDMLITTPETVQVLFTGARLREALKTVRWVVVDEVHELAGGERGAQFAVALERLERVVFEGKRQREGKPGTKDALHPPTEPLSGFQRIGLSATVGSPDAVAAYLGGVGRAVDIVNVTAAKAYDIRVEMPRAQHGDAALAKKFATEPGHAALVRRLAEELRAHEQVLVFSNTRDGAELVGARLRLLDEALPVGVHHGSLSRDVRIEMEEGYKTAKLKGLVCTSSLELGIDIGATDLVVQLNSPRGIARMLQRVGRAGHRAGEVSRGLVLCDSEEEFAESLVVARRAVARELPPLEIRPLPLAVLANQLVSTCMEYAAVGFDWALHLLRGTHPFRELTPEQLRAVLEQLDGQRTVLVDFEARALRRRPRSREYFLDNISMIPDERTFPVIDAAARRSLGTLDESFVLSACQPGQVFIMRGRPWVVVEVDEERVLVAAAKELGAVPNWVGEDLPVPFEVAREVGALRRRLAAGEAAAIATEYRTDAEHLAPLARLLERQREKGLAVPDDRTVTVEVGERLLLLNACWGTRVNETFARLLGALLAQRTGASVAVTSDAYRIALETTEEMTPDLVLEVLRGTEPKALGALLRLALRNSTYIRWHLIHVARKFGALARDVDPGQFSMRRLLELFESMVLFDEAVEKVLWERMDVPRGEAVLAEIRDGTTRLVVQRLSPMGLHGLEAKRDLMLPARADRAILDALHQRLLDTSVTLACVNCGKTWSRAVRDAARDGPPRCSQCSGRMVAVLGPFEARRARLLKKKGRSAEEDREVRRLWKNAGLVASFGARAVVALAARGVGPEAAGRILGRFHDEPGFLRALMEAELRYARTRSFWK